MKNSMHKVKTGRKGEDAAARYLEKQGFRIIDRNFKTREGEIDIIAWDEDVLVFIEVKTSNGDQFGEPETWVDERKQQRICATSEDYMYRKEIEDTSCRYDVVAVMYKQNQMRIKHIPDAFWAVF